jgi:hypothetical protein
MGLRFVGLAYGDADFLGMALRGLPPPLPKRDPRSRVIEIERPSIDEHFGLPDVVLADGRRFVFRAAGELLTAGRGPIPVIAPVIAPRPLATVHRLSSPMSAILDRAAMRVAC